MAEAVRKRSKLDAFLASVGYPERATEGVALFTLRVDGMAILAEVKSDGRIMLSHVLTADAALLPALTKYAAGRIMREDAALAYDAHGLFLWQDAPADADAHGWIRLFETFADSCDWWRERVDALRGETTGLQSADDVVIRP